MALQIGRIPTLGDNYTPTDGPVLFIPAHTRGHIAHVFDEARAIFCGDTLFAAGCGRLFEGTLLRPRVPFLRSPRGE